MGGFTSTLRAVLDLDINPFSRNGNRVEGLSDKLGKSIANKLGAKDAFKSVFATLGISIESIAEKITDYITKPTQEAIKQLDALAESQKRLDAAQTQKIMGGLSPEQQIAFYKEIAVQSRDRAKSADTEAKRTAALADAVESENRARDLQKTINSRTAAERTAQLEAEKNMVIDNQLRVARQMDEEAAAVAKNLAERARDWADFFKGIDDASRKNIEAINAEQQAASDQRKALEEERRTRYMTDEQKLADVVKQGRAAQAALNANPNDEKARLKVEELRAKYLDLRDAIKSANAARDGKGANDPDFADRNEKGQIERNGAVVSQEDRNRARATTARNASLNEKTRSQQIQSMATKAANQPGAEFKTALSTSEGLLGDIKTAVTTTTSE